MSPTRRCGRNCCADLLRIRLRLEDNEPITTTMPGHDDDVAGYICGHGIAFWIRRKWTTVEEPQ